MYLNITTTTTTTTTPYNKERGERRKSRFAAVGEPPLYSTLPGKFYVFQPL